jgi:hypothetical protein
LSTFVLTKLEIEHFWNYPLCSYITPFWITPFEITPFWITHFWNYPLLLLQYPFLDYPLLKLPLFAAGSWIRHAEDPTQGIPQRKTSAPWWG